MTDDDRARLRAEAQAIKARHEQNMTGLCDVEFSTDALLASLEREEKLRAAIWRSLNIHQTVRWLDDLESMAEPLREALRDE